jgi:RHH-type rel operon transcriptional repressor/antitoxin RelB
MEVDMLSVRVSKELENRIIHLAEATKRSRSYYVEYALKKFLDEQEDYLLALSRLEEKGPNITLAEAKKQLGFSDD